MLLSIGAIFVAVQTLQFIGEAGRRAGDLRLSVPKWRRHMLSQVLGPQRVAAAQDRGVCRETAPPPDAFLRGQCRRAHAP